MLARHWMLPLLMGLSIAPRVSWGQADATEEPKLVWSAPPECPPAAHIEDQLRRWLGSEYDSARGDVRADARVTWENERWSVLVRLRRGGDESARNVVVGSCTEAADFVALSVALLINPGFSPTEEGTVAEEGSVAEEGRVGEAEPSSSETAAGDDDRRRSPTSASGESPRETEPSEDADEREVPRPFIAPRSPAFTPVLRMGGGLRTGVFPGPAPVALVQVGLRWSAWRARLGMMSTPYAQHTAEAALEPAVFRSLVGQGETCRQFTWGSFSLGPCLGIEAGVLSAAEKGEKATPLFWTAAQFFSEAELAWGWGAAFLQLGVQVPFTRPEFRLEGGTPVHRSQAGFDGKMGFSVFL